MDKEVLKEIKVFNIILKKCFDKKIVESGLDNFSQVRIVNYLVDNYDKDICQKDIENFTNYGKVTVSGILDTLEKKKIIERIPSVEDGRKKYVKLKDDAYIKHRDINMEVKNISDFITRGVSSDKLNIFFEVLDIMKKNLEDDV